MPSAEIIIDVLVQNQIDLILVPPQQPQYNKIHSHPSHMNERSILDLTDDVLCNILSMVVMDGIYGARTAALSCKSLRGLCEDECGCRSVEIRDAVLVFLESVSASHKCSALDNIRSLADKHRGDPKPAYLYDMFMACSPTKEAVAEGLVYLNYLRLLSLMEFLKIRKSTTIRVRMAASWYLIPLGIYFPLFTIHNTLLNQSVSETQSIGGLVFQACFWQVELYNFLGNSYRWRYWGN